MLYRAVLQVDGGRPIAAVYKAQTGLAGTERDGIRLARLYILKFGRTAVIFDTGFCCRHTESTAQYGGQQGLFEDRHDESPFKC